MKERVEIPINISLREKQNFNASFEGVEKISTSNYDDLFNKPRINAVELKGNKTFEDLGDKTLTNREIKQIFDRVFKGGQ